jgi:hypothetical protein
MSVPSAHRAIAAEPAQLVIYRFAAGTAFEGHLVSALERLEAGGALRVKEVLIVGSEAGTGETLALDLHARTAGIGGLVGPLIGFRLDSAERAAATKRALARSGALVAALAATLEPGETVAAFLIGHIWARVLGEAVTRAQGSEIANAMVRTGTLEELAGEVLAAATAASTPAEPHSA